VDEASVDFAGEYIQSQQILKDRYDDFEIPYNGTDNDDYVNGGGFCCDDHPKLRAGAIGNRNDNPEIYQYYYHSDHLGSTSLITDLDGGVVQHVEYVPFGEVFIEERNNKWNTPYLFNAKELDEETGLYYYGVRYYDPRVSVWLSADPLAEERPWLSPYAYSSNNPVNRIDPTGLIDYAINDKGYIHVMKDANGNILGKNNKFDRLFVGDKPIRVNDTKLLSQLAANPDAKSHSAITSNSTDVFTLFKFAADNSNVEWSLSGFKDNNQNKFYLNTQHAELYSLLGYGAGGAFNEKDMLFNVHSHVFENGAKGGSGYKYDKFDPKTGKYVLSGYDSFGGSDGIPAAHLYDTTGKVMPLYVYHRYSKGLYKYTPWSFAERKWLNIQSGIRLRSIIYLKK